MKTIYYRILQTNSRNVYLELEPLDQDWVLGELMRVQAYMGELSISKDATLKEIAQWWGTSSRHYPYSTRWKRHNSPESFCSGLLNNLVFGTQRNFSLEQVTGVSELLNSMARMQPQIATDYNLNLQPLAQHETVEFIHRI